MILYNKENILNDFGVDKAKAFIKAKEAVSKVNEAAFFIFSFEGRFMHKVAV